MRDTQFDVMNEYIAMSEEYFENGEPDEEGGAQDEEFRCVTES